MTSQQTAKTANKTPTTTKPAAKTTTGAVAAGISGSTKAGLRGKTFSEQEQALSPGGAKAGGKTTAGGGATTKPGAATKPGGTQGGAANKVGGGVGGTAAMVPNLLNSMAETAAVEDSPGFWETIGDGLRAADRWLEGGGDDCDWAHGSRLVGSDGPRLGPAVRGYADRDIDIDLILALANAKGMSDFKSLNSFSGLRGKSGLELLEAIGHNSELGAGMLEKLVNLFTTVGDELETEGEPDLAKKMETLVAQTNAAKHDANVHAAGFSEADDSEGLEAEAKHPNEGYIEGLGWVKKVEIVVQYNKITQGNKVYEKVAFADGVTLYGIDGTQQPGMPREVKADQNYFFAGGTYYGRGSLDGSKGRGYQAAHVPRPGWAKR